MLSKSVSRGIVRTFSSVHNRTVKAFKTQEKKGSNIMKKLFVLFAVYALPMVMAACGGSVSRDAERSDVAIGEAETGATDEQAMPVCSPGDTRVCRSDGLNGVQICTLDEIWGDCGTYPDEPFVGEGGSPAIGGTSSTGGSPSIDPIDDGSEGGSDPVLATGGSATTSTGGSIIAQAGASSDVEAGGSAGAVVVENKGEGGSAGSSPSIIGNGGAAGSDGDEEDLCDSFTILDGSGVEHEVTGNLEFNLSPDSPSGTIDSGLQTVLSVDVTAHCDDMVLERILFQTVSEWGGGMSWMWHLQDVVTGVSYLKDDTLTFHGYGPDHAELPYSSVTGMYWDHAFAEPIVIPEGETKTISLQITLDDLRLPFGTIEFNLYSRANFYGMSDPDAYPQDISFGGVVGNPLTYRGTIDGSATYCQPWSTDGESFGYIGCCGTFAQSDVAPPAGSLLKGSSPAVYYMASDGKRHLLPTSNVIDSWYGPFNWYATSGEYEWSNQAVFPEEHPAICNAVLEVSDTVLAGIELGGIVTFCPGTYVTGLTLEEDRYVITSGKELRKIDETIATEIFGEEMSQMFFGSLQYAERPLLFTPEFMYEEYVIGEPITDASEYVFRQGRYDGIESFVTAP